MSYTVWIVVEKDDGIGDLWWSIDHFDTEAEAIAHAEEICAQEHARTGIEPERLED